MSHTINLNAIKYHADISIVPIKIKKSYLYKVEVALLIKWLKKHLI